MRGVLLVNLGTPTAPTSTSVKFFLKEFLSDPYVIPNTLPFKKIIFDYLILPWRAKKSALLYQKIWTSQGSPLLHFTQEQAERLQTFFCENNITVSFAMRYGTPSIESRLAEFKKLNIKEIFILPLYPQYSFSTTLSVHDFLQTYKPHFLFHFIDCFYKHPDYIHALATHVKTYWEIHGRGNKILFSFHGLPFASIAQGDPYSEQCHTTSTLLAEKLNLTAEDYITVFQSRFGFQKWLEPSCMNTLLLLAKQNFKRIDVFCPGFVTDCLETLEEIAIRNKKRFFAAGGKSFHYIPSLNAAPSFIHALKNIIFNTTQ
ncbi:MAG: Ferrochelatase [uncultured bacterium]|nr:MAG: Ferrochelatase [uncultured bacterium]OGT67805.1 MAG: ferrochelatase [Gammaproteobacteria bacterium RIFCSPLOWO2_02_FULL_38_11]